MFNEYSLVKDHINKCIRNFNCYYTDFKFLIFPVTSYIIYLCDKYKIHPNFITICGAIFSFFFIFSFLENNFIFCLIFFYIRTVLDFVDGGLARYSNKISKFGASCDKYLDFIFFFSVWIVYFISLELPENLIFVLSILPPFIYINYVIDKKVEQKKIPKINIKNKLSSKGILFGFSSFGQIEFYLVLYFWLEYKALFFLLIILINIDFFIRIYEFKRYSKH